MAKSIGIILKSPIKLSLNLTILAGLYLLTRYGYSLFTEQWKEPLKYSIILIAGIATWIAIIKLSRSGSRFYWLRYKNTRPGFKLTTFSLLALFLIFAFAGVQPLVGYKDILVSELSSSIGAIAGGGLLAFLLFPSSLIAIFFCLAVIVWIFISLRQR